MMIYATVQKMQLVNIISLLSIIFLTTLRYTESTIVSTASKSESKADSGINLISDSQSETESGTKSDSLSNRFLVQGEYCQLSSEESYTQYEESCLTSCHLIGGTPQPSFGQWENLCLMQSRLGNALHPSCITYYDCLLGCDIHKTTLPSVMGGEISSISVAGNRRAELIDKLAISNGNSVVSEEKEVCDMWKCASYCARYSFLTCKEMQFSLFCKAETRRSMVKCSDLDCNRGVNRFGGKSDSIVLNFLSLSTLLLIVRCLVSLHTNQNLIVV